MIPHRITVTDPENRRGDCSVCGPDIRLRRRERRGSVDWSCGIKHRQQAGPPPGRPHRRVLKPDSTCSDCGFVPAHLAQMDVHHLDGDHGNNDAQNLQVLCANCHRLRHVVVAVSEAL